MHILSHKITTTKDAITAQAGLLAPLQLMESLGLTERISQHLPTPESHRGCAPSRYVHTMRLMLHAGGECLEAVRHLREDSALLGRLAIKPFPTARALGDWLHRIGNNRQIFASLIPVNQGFLQAALGGCKAVTLDIDAVTSSPTKSTPSGHIKAIRAICPWGAILPKQTKAWLMTFANHVPPNKDNCLLYTSPSPRD